MYLTIFFAAFLVFIQILKVHLYQDAKDPELNNDSVCDNCYDEHGNVIVCPHNPNDPPGPDDDVSCLPNQPDRSLGPDAPRTKKRSATHPSKDCTPKFGCIRHFFVARELVESMTEAQTRCENRGMRLVSIENKEKWRDVVNAIISSGYPSQIYWTSGKREYASSEEFLWGNGCPFTFTKWGYQDGVPQPDNKHYGWWWWQTGEECVEIAKDLTWNDYACEDGWRHEDDYKKSYICESLSWVCKL